MTRPKNTPHLGLASAKYFMDATELGPITPAVTDDMIVRRFLERFEMIATYQINMPRGILVLAAPDNDPKAGAILFYDHLAQKFYDLLFEEGDDSRIPPEDFREIVEEYGLLSLGESAKPVYLKDLLLRTLEADPTVEAATAFENVYLRTVPPKRHSDQFDA